MLVQTLPPAPPAIVAPATKSSRDEFPKCRAAGGGGPVVYTCPKQTKTYALLLTRPMVDPEHGEMVEEFTAELTITAGYIPGEGGDITRMAAMVAPDGWTIAALFDMAEPDVEF